MEPPKIPSIAKIQVPGSTSNLGPGFDCMGMALQIYNQITVWRTPSAAPTTQSQAMVEKTATCFFQAADVAPHPFEWSIKGDVPISRGLGSSVTLRHGILQGLNELAARPLTTMELFRLTASLEGHPDNASAGAFGGFTCTDAKGTLFQTTVEPRLKLIVLIPSTELLTESSRTCLPANLPRKDAVQSLGNACLITAAFASRQYELLRGCFEDHFHQPYRANSNPGLNEVILAGTEAGAFGGFLSGSGSTIACVSLDTNGEAIASAMQAAYKPIGEAVTRILNVDNDGAQVLEVGE